jgi:hypothetical protein
MHGYQAVQLSATDKKMKRFYTNVTLLHTAGVLQPRYVKMISTKRLNLI